MVGVVPNMVGVAPSMVGVVPSRSVKGSAPLPPPLLVSFSQLWPVFSSELTHFLCFVKSITVTPKVVHVAVQSTGNILPALGWLEQEYGRVQHLCMAGRTVALEILN